MKKVLNLFAGIGGNRKHWKDVEVTAIEYNEEIANVYKQLHPNDNVIVADAHEYLAKHWRVRSSVCVGKLHVTYLLIHKMKFLP